MPTERQYQKLMSVWEQEKQAHRETRERLVSAEDSLAQMRQFLGERGHWDELLNWLLERHGVRLGRRMIGGDL